MAHVVLEAFAERMENVNMIFQNSFEVSLSKETTASQSIVDANQKKVVLLAMFSGMVDGKK